ncbi:MAG TPA: DNA-directed RNA polymerase subunit omega [Actinobacteria bacterium]|nr:DNA-directed RNA polymerase subunit omega [Actinomycetota bacterium]
MLIEPPIGELVDRVGSRFGLAVLAARRARQINAYFNELGAGVGGYVPPQVHSLARMPLSIAMQEIAEGKVVPASEPDAEE